MSYRVKLPGQPHVKEYERRKAALAQLRADPRCRPKGWEPDRPY